MKLTPSLSQAVFDITTYEELQTWLKDVDKELGGIIWTPLGGITNNVHTVEVASDPALALVERPTNSIDALLDLKARELGQSAPTPHEAARQWWSVPDAGLSAMSDGDRRNLADNIRVRMIESGVTDRPTIIIQDSGTGQHPDDFANTHLSLLASNKKSSMHVMGVYNAGGAATYKFARGVIIASRLAPTLLNGLPDEIGVSVVRHNPLDPEKFKSGVYEYITNSTRDIIRLDLQDLPDLGHGTYLKLVEYQLTKYVRAAHEPKSSLWHLFHAALPDPALPIRIIEERVSRFTGLSGPERRVVAGLLHLMRRPGVADYNDERAVDLGTNLGRITIRYFVLNEGRDPDAYTTSSQGLTITLNGQRQITRDRLWLKRNLELFFLFKRLVVLVDATELTNYAKREVFSSTREAGVDSPVAKLILDRVVAELSADDHLYDLEEHARQKTLESATKTTTDKVKRQLAGQISAILKGKIGGAKGGLAKKHIRKAKRRRGTGKPPVVDDSLMPTVPDKLAIISQPLRIQQGGTAALQLEINGKNDFLPRYANGLSVVFGSSVKDKVRVVSTGRLLGGRVRVTVEAEQDAPLGKTKLQVALVVPELSVLLNDDGELEVIEEKKGTQKDATKGGEPNIEIKWVGRSAWDQFDPVWDEEAVGLCNVYREDPNDQTAITKVEWVLNEAFASYEQVVDQKEMGEAGITSFRERYEFPVALGLFRQRLAEDAKESEADEEGRMIEVPDDYVKGEKARLARAALMAMEPELTLLEAVEA